MNMKRKILKKAICSLCAASLMVTMVHLNEQTINVNASDNSVGISMGDLEPWNPVRMVSWQQYVNMFPDSNLFNAVNAKLHIGEGESFEYSRLAGVDEIYVKSENGETINLSGVEVLTGLTKISITGNISSIEPINSLTILNELNLKECKNITSFEGIQAPSLLYLFVSGCDGLTGLKGLENCPNLMTIKFTSCYGIQDISACGVMSNLHVLELYACKNLSDISALKDLNTLQNIDLYNTKVSDISPLRDKTSLTKLDLGYTEVFKDNEHKKMNCDVLSSLKPEVLYLRGSGVDDDVMKTIFNMTSLNHLESLDNTITDISEIGKLSSLTGLDIGGNRITDLSPLSSLPNLRGYHMSNNGEKAQYVEVSGSDYIIRNPYIGMDGKPVVPDESQEYTYNPTDNTITINEAYRTEDRYWIYAHTPMNYNGNTFTMKLSIYYEFVENEIVITKQPESVTCTEGEKISLSVEAKSEDEDFTYKWYKNDVLLENETGNFIVIDKSALSDAGEYRCVISNNSSSAESDVATVTVNEEETTEEPSTEEPSTEEPSTEEPSTEEPSIEEPSTEEPSTKKVSTEQTTTKKSVNDSKETPKTGDDSMMVVFVVLMVISAGVVVGRKKIKE